MSTLYTYCKIKKKLNLAFSFSGKEEHANFVQDSKLGFVINAVTIMAQALHNMHQDICGGLPGICPQMSPPEGGTYLRYLLNVSLITYSNDEIHFDKNGDPPARYCHIICNLFIV